MSIGSWVRWMTSVGVIAEDRSDFDTLTILIQKLAPTARFKFRRALGKGCGKVQSKCLRYSRLLQSKGCAMLIILRDADGKDVDELLAALESASTPNPIAKKAIIIPVQAIEAWLLADMEAVHRAFSLSITKVTEYSNPERVADPKRTLKRFVDSRFGKTYVHTIHNAKIAQRLSINKLAKCRSFAALRDFVTNSKH